MNRKQRRNAEKNEKARQARLANPKTGADIEALFSAGAQHHLAGRFGDAEEAYQRVLRADPSHVKALHNTGLLAAQAGDDKTALEFFRNALGLQPDYVDAHYNLGNLLLQLQEFEDAAASFERVIALQPDHAYAHNGKGISLWKGDDEVGALACFEAALELRANMPEALTNKGNILRMRGQFDKSLECFDKAIGASGTHAEAHANKGVLLKDRGSFDGALRSLDRALELDPQNHLFHFNKGTVLGELEDYEAALICFDTCLNLNPKFHEGRLNRGTTLYEMGRLDEALDCYGLVPGDDATSASAYMHTAKALQQLGRLDDAVENYRRALEREADPVAESNLLLCLQYMQGTTNEQLNGAARDWARRYADPLSPPEISYPNRAERTRKLRVGYISADFRTHSVSFFFEPLLASHDRTNFEIYCYARVAKPDRTTDRLAEMSDHWRSIFGVPDGEVAERIRADAIDILVELGGHTAKNGLLACARRPAPVQIAWLGYPGTTGMSAFDYRLTDAVADPQAIADPFHSEELIRLADGFLCFLPPADAPDAVARDGAADGPVFGSFNNLVKVTSEVIDTWAAILNAVPGSRLLLKSSGEDTKYRRDEFLERFEQSAVDRSRVDIIGATKSIARHLALYAGMDVALDTFPYNGTTTSCEAMWMGVPVVTLAGDRHASRVGASLMAQMGLDELVAGDRDAYVDIAVLLADDKARRAELRAGLRQRMADSPLCDGKAYSVKLEAAYRDMWSRWCETEAVQ